MKKLFAILLTLTMVLGLCSFAGAEGIDEALIAAAKEEGRADRLRQLRRSLPERRLR